MINCGMSSALDSSAGSAAVPAGSALGGVMLILEASTTAGSVALVEGDRVLAEREVAMGAGQSDGLFPAVQDVLREGGIQPSALSALVCGDGPGSFTSLRIAASLVKGLGYGSGLPLYGVPSMLLAAAALPPSISGDLVLHADALRGERYVLPVHRWPTGRVAAAGPAARIPIGELLAQTQASQRVAVVTSPEELPGVATVVPRAALLPQVDGPWRDRPVDLASWEPQYGRLAEAQVKWEASHGRALPPLLSLPLNAG
ncbi:peptidase M22 family protein [Gemmatimonas aurantiaca T-27]|uniref:Peptidase M22 family protein n=2 Tax=Gemmatimonas aurantiaca TaxID=173480 RepID=C1A4G7_GEMAT|nr:peptidase M22 family protein [Gemmatimonas aurantiaca T-27]